jgi:hypothetical protein
MTKRSRENVMNTTERNMGKSLVVFSFAAGSYVLFI